MESPLRGHVPTGTQLIETFGAFPNTGPANVTRHLQRMERTAVRLGFPFDTTAAQDCVAGINPQTPLRCRLTLDQSGQFNLTTAPFDPAPLQWTIAIADQTLRADDPWLAHKTTQRALYDSTRATLPTGIDEMIFENERGEICEGTITNIFVTLEDGTTLTPPLRCGVLPGIFRQMQLETGKVREGIVTRDMLRGARAIYLGNALRGKIQVRFLHD